MAYEAYYKYYEDRGFYFDRGLLTVDESFRVCVAATHLPAGLESLINPGHRIRLPALEHHWPHANFLRWHRENRFKG